MIPDKRVTDNIKKLIKLGMSEKDIVAHLKKMGVNEDNAKKLINFAKDKKTLEKQEPKDKKEEKTKEEQLPKDLFKEEKIEDIKDIDDEKEDEFDISSGLDVDAFKKYTDQADEDSKEDKKTTVNEKEDFNFNIDNNKENNDYDVNLNNQDKETNIWESGMLTTLNTKLSEIEDKQKTVEEYLRNKIDQEINKYKKVQETTKNLLLSKLNEQVSQEKQNLMTMVTKQLAQIKIEQAKLNKKLSEIDTGKKDISDKIQEFDEIKEKASNDYNKIETEIKKVAASMTVKINQKIKQINEILTLQSKISQGLIKNTKTAAEKEIAKIAEFKEKVDAQINPKKLYDKLEELEKYKEQLAKRYDNRFEDVKSEFLKKAHVAFKNKIDSELKEVRQVKEEVVKKTDPEIINKKLKELEEFEKHLLTNIDEKITQSLNIYESGITQEFRGKIKEIDNQIKKTEELFTSLETAKESIKEISGFKDQFISIIDKNIEKMNKTMSYLEEKIKKVEEN